MDTTQPHPETELTTNVQSMANTSTGDIERPKEPDLSPPHIQKAIEDGRAAIAEGKSKADAARAIFDVLKTEQKDVIVAAFVAGATLTPAGAQTYYYNAKRKAAKT